MRQLVQQYPVLGERVLFGTDWSMIGKEPTQNEYVAQVYAAAEDVGFIPRRIFRENAVRYLGLGPNGAQFRRLSRFFGRERLEAALSDPV